MLIRPRVFIRSYTAKSVETPAGAFTQRLKDLEEQYPSPDDPLLGKQQSSLIDKDPTLSAIQQTADQKAFEYQNQVSIQATRVPQYADKVARDTAHSSPWRGTEHAHDTSLRMLVDKHKPLRGTREAKKLLGAREAVLDFKINKPQEGIDEDTAFRNIYTEKFTPIGSYDKIKTLADARIEDAMRRGEFNNIPRGKLEVEVKPYVDRTEHHLNNILVKQNIVPPWIEKQGGVNAEISGFKRELEQKWMNHIRHFYEEDHEAMKKEFERRWKNIFSNKVQLVNSSIRTYNLQAPLSTQKFYLLVDKEFARCYDSFNVDALRERFEEESRIQAAKLEMELSAPRFNGWKFWTW